MSNNDFLSMFFNGTEYPSFTFKNVDDSSLEKFRQVVAAVKIKSKGSQITINYKVETKELDVSGTGLDLYYFGYFTKQFE